MGYVSWGSLKGGNRHFNALNSRVGSEMKYLYSILNPIFLTTFRLFVFTLGQKTIISFMSFPCSSFILSTSSKSHHQPTHKQEPAPCCISLLFTLTLHLLQYTFFSSHNFLGNNYLPIIPLSFLYEGI